MSEIKEKVKRNLEAILTYEEISTMEKVQSILSIKELACVDRKAELPEVPEQYEDHYKYGNIPAQYYKEAMERMKAEGWRKILVETECSKKAG